MLNAIAPVGEPVPITTPDFARQAYLGPAPAGIDAHFVDQRGGRGWDVRVIDLEWGRDSATSIFSRTRVACSPGRIRPATITAPPSWAASAVTDNRSGP